MENAYSVALKISDAVSKRRLILLNLPQLKGTNIKKSSWGLLKKMNLPDEILDLNREIFEEAYSILSTND